MAYGLPVEGDDGPFVGEQADPVPTCRADQTVADARNVLEGPDAREVVVVAGDDLAVGLVDAERLDGAAHDTPLLDVMVVVPSSSIDLPSSSAATPEAITPEVLPWSCAVPIVV
jgi:CBS domain-containing protein